MNEDLAETEWRHAFRRRVREAREKKNTVENVAKVLGIDPGTYRKYEAPKNGETISARATIMPVRYLPTFCRICNVSLEWLIEGEQVAVVKHTPSPRYSRQKAKRA